MKKLSSAKQKLFDFIGAHQGVSLEEIKHWGSLDFVRGYTVNEFCRELVREGAVKASLVADGVTLYSIAKQENGMPSEES